MPDACQCGHPWEVHRGDGLCLHCGCGDDGTNLLASVRNIVDALRQMPTASTSGAITKHDAANYIESKFRA